MSVRDLHSWSLDYTQAIALQKTLASKVKFTRLPKRIRLVAGVDCAFTAGGKEILACIVVLAFPQLEIIELKWARKELSFPYIPGLLSFREAPACLKATAKLENEPDVFIVDGQGIAHPRRLGIASHLGLFLDKPTIGCAKSRLTGTYDEPHPEKGSRSLLCDANETIGAVLRTRTSVKPVFVSVGHKCTLDDAVRLCLDCSKGYRIPEPTRLADREVAVLKRSLAAEV
jgi:deoxyribonuclease V